MKVFLDIETVPCAVREPFLAEAQANFKAPSTLTKAQAGADLKLSADEIKFTSANDLILRWEKEMAKLKAPEVADLAWRKTALDGTKGRVLSIAWEGPTGGPKLHIGNPDNEREQIEAFIDALMAMLIEHGTARPPFFIGHSLLFDLKFLFRRCVILGIRPPFAFPFHGRHDKDYFCTMEAWCSRGEFISLANLCAALNIESNNDMDGSQVCDYWLAGRYGEIGAYNLDDVATMKCVYWAQTFSQVA